MIAAPLAYPKAQGSYLAACHIDSGRIRSGFRLHAILCQQFQHRFFHQRYQTPDAKQAPPQINHQVHHYLAGSVVGNLTATVRVHHRNV